jgi:hypothetical protein
VYKRRKECCLKLRPSLDWNSAKGNQSLLSGKDNHRYILGHRQHVKILTGVETWDAYWGKSRGEGGTGETVSIETSKPRKISKLKDFIVGNTSRQNRRSNPEEILSWGILHVFFFVSKTSCLSERTIVVFEQLSRSWGILHDFFFVSKTSRPNKNLATFGSSWGLKWEPWAPIPLRVLGTVGPPLTKTVGCFFVSNTSGPG